MNTESSIKPSSPALLPKGWSEASFLRAHAAGGEGSKKDPVHYRGGFGYSGLVDTARELRQKETKAEKIVWHILRNRSLLGLKFRRDERRDSQPRTVMN